MNKMNQRINLSELDNQPADIQEAAAFYASFGVTPTAYTKEERERFYAILENAGLIEKVGEIHGTN
jgi:hypothetical protein